jgi:hypothetical protein
MTTSPIEHALLTAATESTHPYPDNPRLTEAIELMKQYVGCHSEWKRMILDECISQLINPIIGD